VNGGLYQAPGPSQEGEPRGLVFPGVTAVSESAQIIDGTLLALGPEVFTSYVRARSGWTIESHLSDEQRADHAVDHQSAGQHRMLPNR
jgi:hypothetical protein